MVRVWIGMHPLPHIGHTRLTPIIPGNHHERGEHMDNRRTEILIPDDMKKAGRKLAERRGLGDLSSLIRFMLAGELTSEYGNTWRHDHHGGDHETGKALSK